MDNSPVAMLSIFVSNPTILSIPADFDLATPLPRPEQVHDEYSDPADVAEENSRVSERPIDSIGDDLSLDSNPWQNHVPSPLSLHTLLSPPPATVVDDNVEEAFGLATSVVQSMLAALSPLAEPAMGNEYHDEDDNLAGATAYDFVYEDGIPYLSFPAMQDDASSFADTSDTEWPHLAGEVPDEEPPSFSEPLPVPFRTVRSPVSSESDPSPPNDTADSFHTDFTTDSYIPSSSFTNPDRADAQHFPIENRTGPLFGFSRFVTQTPFDIMGDNDFSFLSLHPSTRVGIRRHDPPTPPDEEAGFATTSSSRLSPPTSDNQDDLD